MRLLNTISMELEEFWENEIPQYAILSHTWEKEEVSFLDMQSGNAKSKAGYAKILGCCRQAKLHKLEYVWIDTCCIDKSSSAELTEAINSMYRWYQMAQICYAYLSDVDNETSLNPERQKRALAQSRWFTRGWTLQELIAPRKLEIYSQKWNFLGRKSDLTNQLSDITGVPVSILANPQEVAEASLAARMSWASQRVTTRVEDMAYCLMGIFGINMPLLYGEGGKAFFRLQEEIIKVSNDHSLFTWTHSYITGYQIFAVSPKCFSNSRHIVRIAGPGRTRSSATTNRGLRIELALVRQTESTGYGRRSIALLDCVDSRWNLPIGIKVLQISRFGDNSYCRIDPQNLWTVKNTGFIRKGLSVNSEMLQVSELLPQVMKPPVYSYQNKISEPSGSFILYDVHPFDEWIPYEC